MTAFLKDHEKTAFNHKDRAYSYRQILAGAHDYARRAKTGAGERIMICSENRPEWACAFYSAWANGAIPVPCDFMSTADELAYILADSTAAAIFVTSRTAELIQQTCALVPGNKARIVNMDEMSPDFEGAVPGAIGPDDTATTAVIIYTSGTTGNPKGVMLSFDNILTQIGAIAESPSLPLKDTIFFKKDRTVAILPMHHILPLMATMVLPMYVGITVSFIANLTADDIFAAFQQYKPTYLIGVPRLYEMFHGGIMKKIRASGCCARCWL